MKQLIIPILAVSCLLTQQTNAQAPDVALADTVTHAAQAQGLVGKDASTIVSPKGTQFFTAYIDGSDDPAIRRVSLRWQLESEFNTDNFVVERSSELNPIHFDPIHQIVSRGDPAGVAYDDRDAPPEGTVSYYRLKVVLKNGESFYSPVVAVNMNNKTSLALKPSVLTTGGTLHFNGNTDHRPPVTVNFFDTGGRLVSSFLVSGSYFDINTSGWTRGVYIYRISDGQHPLIQSGKIMIM